MSTETSFTPINLKEFESQAATSPYSKVSIYITPNGDIIDCRNLTGNHISFTGLIYKNLSMFSDIEDEMGYKVYQSLTEGKNFEGMTELNICREVRKMLVQNTGLNPKYPVHSRLISEAAMFIPDDDLLVHDMGFVKVCIIPRFNALAVCTPAKCFNGHRATAAQRGTFADIADFYYFDEAEVSDCFRTACRESEDLDRKIESSTIQQVL
jgi:hypothetical protein